MVPPQSTRPFWQRWIIRHLFLYLALIGGVSVGVAVLAARDDLVAALRGFPPVIGVLVLSLSVVNYAIRFLKWDRLLSDARIEVPRAASARIYFACLAMVVTPARLGELYKLVFLRRLHAVPAARSLPPLVLERATDALGLLALCAAQPFAGPMRAVGVLGAGAALVALAAALASPHPRKLLLSLAGRLPVLRSRTDRIAELVDGHARLLAPRSFAPNIALSILAWWAEAIGLWLICRGLAETLAVGQATWIYSASTLLGNLTFLPGGLGGTEIALKMFLEGAGVTDSAAMGATLLVRAATLWFAVGLGLLVTLGARRHLHWSEVREEAARGD
jgi:uncharacterized membrane protein YbhN (UPF0104 family)